MEYRYQGGYARWAEGVLCIPSLFCSTLKFHVFLTTLLSSSQQLFMPWKHGALDGEGGAGSCALVRAWGFFISKYSL